MPPAPPTVGTEQHAGPEPSRHDATWAALVCAWPKPRALAVPTEPVVGRDWLERCGLADPKVSSSHLSFRRSGAQLFVKDVGSKNGTWLDGRPLEHGVEYRLEDGAVLRLGTTVFVVRSSFSGAPEPDATRLADGPAHRVVSPFGFRSLWRDIDALRTIGARNVLLEGRTGTGKEALARIVANTLQCAAKSPFGVVNVTALAGNTFESELFGHERGAFTGADRARKGIVRENDGGTVFLDELGDLPLPLQAKLLRLVENREVQPLGADKPLVVDVTVVAATQVDLDERVKAGEFRADLLARFASARLDVPSLAERPEDIMPIALEIMARRGWLPGTTEVEAVERLLLGTWSENVRGLAAVIDRAATLDEPGALRVRAVKGLDELKPRDQRKERPTRELAEQVVARLGSERAAADELGISRGAMRTLIGRR